MIRHINPSKEQQAIAPYNFVPLPHEPMLIKDGYSIDGAQVKPWEAHDQYMPGTHSGYIALSLETLSPLFIRGPVRKQKDGQWDKTETRLREQPFLTPDGKPVIPGSSLRGMIRNLVEILSFSKLAPVTREKPFFRSVGNDRLGRLYRSKMVSDKNHILGGILHRDGDEWSIERCTTYRVPVEILERQRVKMPHKPNDHPDPKYQRRMCRILPDGKYKVSDIRFDQLDHIVAPWQKAMLVLTGPAPGKLAEFALVSEGNFRHIVIPEAMIERFHDEDQITQWQQKAFDGSSRKPKGGLAEGDAVFYRLDDAFKSSDNPDGLVFFGRAQMFRLPYDCSPWDLLPKEHRSSGLDLARALFGYVAQERGSKDQAVKGRVFFEDAIAETKFDDCAEPLMVPAILAAPKVTTFQHYLTQDGGKDSEGRTTYFSEDKTTLRGHKLYWHRDTVSKANISINEAKKSTQHTLIRPIKAGTQFTGRIRFENITDIELGALLHAASLPEDCAHKLGMGKPLGLGSVRIKATLLLCDRQERYASWAFSGVRQVAMTPYMDAFSACILEHAKRTGETMISHAEELRSIARLDALYHLLSWEKTPPISKTRYMQIENGDKSHFGEPNEYKKRFVLPTPQGVVGAPEPAWKGERPVAAKIEDVEKAQEKKEDRRPKTVTPQSQATRLSTKFPEPPPPKTTKRLISKGDTLPGVFEVNEHKGIARFEGEEIEAAIVSGIDKIEADQNTTNKAMFYVLAKSKKEFRVRLEKLL